MCPRWPITASVFDRLGDSACVWTLPHGRGQVMGTAVFSFMVSKSGMACHMICGQRIYC